MGMSLDGSASGRARTTARRFVIGAANFHPGAETCEFGFGGLGGGDDPGILRGGRSDANLTNPAATEAPAKWS